MHKRGTSSAPLIDGILNSLPGKLCDEKSIDLERFITLYYDQIPDTDLSTATPEDFGGAAISHWQLLQKRKPGEALVKIFNPQLDQHGWQCAHTVIEIVFDDMPLLVNSVSMAVLEKNINIHLTVHPIFNIVRDKDHRIINLPDDQGCPADANASREAVIHMQIDRQADKNQIEQLTRYVDKTLFRVAAINQDKPELEQQVAKLAALLSSAGQPTSDIAHGAGEKSGALANAPSDARLQSSNLLEWLDERHYSVFGSARYQLEDDGNHLQKTNTGLGLLRDTDRHHALTIEETLLAEITAFSWEAASEPSLVITKSNCRSPISRPEALDMLLVFHGQPDARQVDVLIGLFTEQMISRETTDVPILREKVSRIIERSGLPQDSHDCKALKSTLEGLPRDILFQAGSDTVLEIASGIINLQERQRIRLFGTQAPNGTYYNCLAFVPRDSYGRKLRLNIESILLNELKGVRSEFSSSFSSQSTLARLHYVIQTGTPANAQASSDRPDWNHIEERIIQAAIGWDDRLHTALLSKHDENRANDFFSRYRDAFPASYKEDYSARIACSDIEFIERHVTPDFPVMSFYRHIMTDVGTVNFKLFSPQGYIALSDVIPIIENMGLRVDAEHPFQINRKNNFPVWIHEFTVQHIDGMEIDPEASSDNIQQAFSQIWRGAVENDGFNRLIIEADLNWRQIIILRSYCKYLLQIQSPFSQDYMIRSLVNNPSITRSLVTLFENRFDPTLDRRTADKSDEIVAQLETELAQVESLDEDRILRAYVNLVNATVRTNYFCSNPQGQPLPYVSYKLDSQSIEQLPLPHPKYEIFV